MNLINKIHKIFFKKIFLLIKLKTAQKNRNTKNPHNEHTTKQTITKPGQRDV